LKPFRDFYIACAIALCLFTAAMALIAARLEAGACQKTRLSGIAGPVEGS
jgi:hypothetical protein